MCKRKTICIGFIFVLMLNPNAEAKLCKWVDDNGVIHYTDVAPPEYISKEADIANKTMTADKCNEKIASESIRAMNEDAAKNIATKKEIEEKNRRVNALRNTYSNEKEIDMALERNLEPINARIATYNIYLKSSQNTLDDLKKEFENRSKEGKKIPQSLYDDISLTDARITKLLLERAKSEEEIKSTKARFEDDKMLYRKIIVLKPVNDAEKNSAIPYPDNDEANNYPDYRTKSKLSKKARSRSQY